LGELAGLRLESLRLIEHKVEVVETDQGTEPKWGSVGTVTISRSRNSAATARSQPL
jgi:hypothetical protein